MAGIRWCGYKTVDDYRALRHLSAKLTIIKDGSVAAEWGRRLDAWNELRGGGGWSNKETRNPTLQAATGLRTNDSDPPTKTSNTCATRRAIRVHRTRPNVRRDDTLRPATGAKAASIPAHGHTPEPPRMPMTHMKRVHKWKCYTRSEHPDINIPLDIYRANKNQS